MVSCALISVDGVIAVAVTREIKLLTLDQVAERLGVSKRHVYRLIELGELASINIAAGARTRQRVADDELGRFIARRVS